MPLLALLMRNAMCPAFQATHDTLFAFSKKDTGTLFKLLAAKDNTPGGITKNALKHAQEDQAIINVIVRSKNPNLRRLMAKDAEKDVEKAFDKIDTDKSGVIDVDEWEHFIELIRMQRLSYYVQRALLMDNVEVF